MSKYESSVTMDGGASSLQGGVNLSPKASLQTRSRDVAREPNMSRQLRADLPASVPPPAAEETAQPKTAPLSGDGDPAGSATPQKPSKKRFIFIGIAALLALGAAYYGYRYFVTGRYLVSTDDAYVRADMSVLAAKVSGYVSAVHVKDNVVVKVGDPLLTIDDGDYRLAVLSAKARVATQQAAIDRLGDQINAQQANIDQARAMISTSEADVTRTAADFGRTNTLAQSNYASTKSLDQARADQQKALASVVSAKAGLAAAQANLGVVNAQRIEAQQTKAELEINLAKAERDLSFVTVKAPVSGVVGNRAVQVGDFVQTGSRLLAIVPMDSAYIEANFKETQLARMKTGQTAQVTVDALTQRKITGVVESLAPASGSQFSLLPPENATGNFTKIVQRVPVRIKLPADEIAQGGFRVGLSVTVEVDTKDEGGAAPVSAQAKP